jgi:hypothetical protein
MAAARLRAAPDPAPMPTPDVGKTEITISAPRIRTATFKCRGTSPYMQARFSEKAMLKMQATHEAGQQARGKKNRDARDFDKDYEAAKHIATEGWCGIPAGAFRTAMIDVCRLINFKMTMAKLSVFIDPDGFDKVDGTPLVKLHGTPEKHVGAVRNATGVCDLRARPMWREWYVNLRVRYDEDQFSLTDVTNLLSRAGIQCGIGEGRPNSRASTGIGFGTFTIDGDSE